MKNFNNISFAVAFIVINISFAQDIYLGRIEVIGEQNRTNPQSSEYGSSNTVSQEEIEKMPKKESTIAEAIKANPNVAFNKKADKSIDSGEISPKDFSINGASYYQNNFLVDNVNFNYDLDPAGKRPSRGLWWAPTLGSQALNLDTDLFKRIKVIDSGVSAKYGDFQGGVINTKTRDPKEGFHGILSTSYTSKKWSKIFIDPLVEQNYTDNTSMMWLNKSDFVKKRYRAGIEGYVSENFGLLFDYTRTSSVIKNITKPGVMDSSIATQPDDKRKAENYFLKRIINAGDNVVLRPSFLYALQKTEPLSNTIWVRIWICT